jgi:hypothetical protein
MEDPSQSMIFKILNGPQNGVEVALEAGEYSIGSDREDDLQITDVALSAKHGRLRIADGRISISADSGAISTSTGLVLNAGEAGWHDIDQLDVVTLGATRFAVGKASANWAGLLASNTANAPAEKAVRTEGRALLHSGRLVRFGLPALALIILAGFLTIALSSPQSSISSLIKRNSVSDVELVRTAIAKLPFGAQVKVREEVDGSIFASGYVDSLVQRRAVNDAVAGTGVQVRMRLWARDVVRNEVASLIDVRRLPLTFDLTPDGHIVLKGRELDKAKVDELSALISQQVVGVSGVRSEVVTAENVLENVRELARRAKVGEGVLFRLASLDNGGQLIEATGAIRNDQIDAWLGFLKSYASTVADFMALRSYVGIEGQTVIVNNTTPAVPGSTDAVAAKDKTADAVPLILASEKTAPDAFGRRVPLDMFLNNQTSYEKLLDAVAPASSETETLKKERKTADPAKLDAATPPAKDKQSTDTNTTSVDTSVDAGLKAEITPEGTPDSVLETPVDATPTATRPSDSSLMQLLGVSATADLVTGDEETAIAVPQIVTRPVATKDVEDRPKADPSSPETAEDSASPDAVSEPEKTAVTEDTSADVEKTAATTVDASETDRRPSDTSSDSLASKVVTPPILDVAQSMQSDEGQKAARQLQDATTAILKLNKSAKLNDLLGTERGKDVQKALDRISRTVKQAATLRPLIAERARPQEAGACWEGSNITPDVLPTLIFWLDLLSISEKVSIDDLFIDNYGLLLEAGLSPDRVRDCLLRQPDPALAKLATSSIYLEEVGRNPDFIRFLLRSAPSYSLALAGANTTGARYIQLDNGDTLTEGEAPSLDSRIASIGDLGVLVRVPNGYKAEVYPKSMPWMIR